MSIQEALSNLRYVFINETSSNSNFELIVDKDLFYTILSKYYDEIIIKNAIKKYCNLLEVDIPNINSFTLANIKITKR